MEPIVKRGGISSPAIMIKLVTACTMIALVMIMFV